VEGVGQGRGDWIVMHCTAALRIAYGREIEGEGRDGHRGGFVERCGVGEVESGSWEECLVLMRESEEVFVVVGSSVLVFTGLDGDLSSCAILGWCRRD
jgi:hypothetical protein